VRDWGKKDLESTLRFPIPNSLRIGAAHEKHMNGIVTGGAGSLTKIPPPPSHFATREDLCHRPPRLSPPTGAVIQSQEEPHAAVSDTRPDMHVVRSWYDGGNPVMQYVRPPTPSVVSPIPGMWQHGLWESSPSIGHTVIEVHSIFTGASPQCSLSSN